MKIAVIGAGLQGICTAHALAHQGHRVSVLDQNNSAAELASFANGTLLSPVVTSQWLDQVSMGAALRGQFHTPPALGWGRLTVATLNWARRARKLRALSVKDNPRLNQGFALARYSREQFDALCAGLRLDVDRTEGVLLLMRTADEAQRWSRVLTNLADPNQEHSLLDPTQARAIEPALRPDTPLHQAAYLPQDRSANSRQFALLLKAQAEEMGVAFHFNTPIAAFQKNAPVGLIRTAQWQETFDAVVVCAGESTPRLLQTLGLRLPVQRIHGYSISAPLREPLDAPKSAVYDTLHHVSMTRLGQRVRVAGAYTVGQPAGPTKQRLAQLYQVLDDWFPGAARTHDNPQVWGGTVLSTFDGLPLIGKTSVPGLWLNVAHGLSGWTTACGSARLLADQISGRVPALDPTHFDETRWVS